MYFQHSLNKPLHLLVLVHVHAQYNINPTNTIIVLSRVGAPPPIPIFDDRMVHVHVYIHYKYRWLLLCKRLPPCLSMNSKHPWALTQTIWYAIHSQCSGFWVLGRCTRRVQAQCWERWMACSTPAGEKTRPPRRTAPCCITQLTAETFQGEGRAQGERA